MKNQLGTYLRKIRKEKKLSLKALQTRCGIAPSYLSELERGLLTSPSTDSLTKIAMALEIHPSFLYEMMGDQKVETGWGDARNPKHTLLYWLGRSPYRNHNGYVFNDEEKERIVTVIEAMFPQSRREK